MRVLTNELQTLLKCLMFFFVEIIGCHKNIFLLYTFRGLYANSTDGLYYCIVKNKSVNLPYKIELNILKLMDHKLLNLIKKTCFFVSAGVRTQDFVRVKHA